MLRLLSKVEQHRALWLKLLFITCLTPFTLLVFRFFSDMLGVNPYETIMSTTGTTAIVLLLLTLLATPLRRWLCWACKKQQCLYGKRLSDWNYLILSRKTLGNFSALYISLHLLAYLELDMDWDGYEIGFDLTTRAFIGIGLLCWILIVPLVLTSFKRMQKKMGKHWRRLHRAIYLIGVLAVLHVILDAKPTDQKPYFYLIILFVLLGHRVAVTTIKALKKREDTGMEVYRNR